MGFPLSVTSSVDSSNGQFNRRLTLHRGLTVTVGPNGSGKTHLLRGMRQSLHGFAGGKKVRFLSAGRMGVLEQYRSDFDGHRGGNPNYELTHYGEKGSRDRRHQTETLYGDFQTLAARTDILIKIQERIRKLFHRELTLNWDGGYLKVEFARLDGRSKPYSSGREASGLLHLVGLLSALYDDEVGALLIDEPEVSLHPQLQAFLLREMLSVAGDPVVDSKKKLVVIATHSTELIEIATPDDLLSLIFCYDLNSNPIQISADAGELKNKKLGELIARLGQEHKLALFSKRPLLVEGPSDVLICGAIASRTEKHLEAAGSQLLPVIGKGQMPVVAKLLRLLGKEPVVLADADSVADGLDLANFVLANNPEADRMAAAYGAASATSLAGTIYADFCALVDGHWGSIKSKAEDHSYWMNRKADEKQAMRRSAFCAMFDLDDAALAAIEPKGKWLSAKTRCSVLLDLLEAQGCFVLRKGSIESYYQVSDRLTSVGKPAVAVDEATFIRTAKEKTVANAYGEALRAVHFAANAERISEAAAIRDLLLAAVAPSIAKLRDGASTRDVEILTRSVLGDRAEIFQFEVRGKDLVVQIRSSILDVKGFPLSISCDEDAIKKVSAAVKMEAEHGESPEGAVGQPN
jgi:hypothetical protein